VADCFKFHNKIGLDVAMEARQDAWASKQVHMDELWRFVFTRMAGQLRRTGNAHALPC
jgi:hypothetical protein